MKISQALKTPTTELTLEERVKALETNQEIQRASLIAFVGTLAYNDPEFGEVLEEKISSAIHAHYNDGAADIGG